MSKRSNTGNKAFEYPVTFDSSKRSGSYGIYNYYFNGKIYNIGNIRLNSTIPFASGDFSPAIVVYDTANTPKEKYRKHLNFTYRFPSALKGLSTLGNQKFALLKQTGKTASIEIRTNNNKLVWARQFSQKGKFIVPLHLKNIYDTAVVAAFAIYSANNSVDCMKDKLDSILFVRYDSSGKETYSRKILCHVDSLKNCQLLVDPTGTANFFYYGKIQGATTASIYGFNIGSKKDSLYEMFYTDYANYNDLPEENTEPIQHFNGDSLIYCGYNSYYKRPEFSLFANKVNPVLGYFKPYGGAIRLPLSGKINSFIKLNNRLFFANGLDSNNNVYVTVCTGDSLTHILWSKSFNIKGKIIAATPYNNAVYTVLQKLDGNMLIAKLDMTNGNTIWQIEQAATVGNKICPMAVKYNSINNNFSVVGFMYDTSVIASLHNNTYIYVTLDTLGNIIKNVTRNGVGQDDTRAVYLDVLGNGINIYGGTFNNAEFGTSGFYNSECFVSTLTPQVSIGTASTSFCYNYPVTFTAAYKNEGNNAFFQWQINSSNVGNNAYQYTTSTLKDNDTVKVVLTSNANCITTNTAQSNELVMKITTALNPSINIDSVLITPTKNIYSIVSAKDTGTSPSIQWQDSTEFHSWQDIAGEKKNSINYLYPQKGIKIRCKLVANANCNVDTAVSNTLALIINPFVTTQVNHYPNPVNNWLVVDKLNLADQWQYLDILNLSGNIISSQNITGKTTLTVNVSNLTPGLYLGLLRRGTGNNYYFRFMKI